MRDFEGQPIRTFVIWEPVLQTDWSSPSTATLKRISDSRASQFWDKNRLISQAMGEHDSRSIVWDYVSIYPAGSTWEDGPPPALYHGGPVVKVVDEARAGLSDALKKRHSAGIQVVPGFVDVAVALTNAHRIPRKALHTFENGSVRASPFAKSATGMLHDGH
jgi:hypothetical protein